MSASRRSRFCSGGTAPGSVDHGTSPAAWEEFHHAERNKATDGGCAAFDHGCGFLFEGGVEVVNDGLEVTRSIRQLPNQAVHRIERSPHFIRRSEHLCKETLKSIESLLDPQHDVAPRVNLDITSFSNVPFPPPPNGCSNGVESVQRMVLRNDHVDGHGFHVQ